MADMSFLKNFRKTMDKMDNVAIDFSSPTAWYSTGNLALNKIMSGSYLKGIPQGRICVLSGPSGSGKTFVGCNILREAQNEGAFVLALDSENALDENFVSAIGVDTDPSKFMYAGVVTIQDVTSLLSDFIKGYEKEHGRNNPDAPKVVIFLDSLDMLLTDSEDTNFDKGEQKGDMGQRTKLLKHMLRTVVSRISRLNITFIATHQVYANQNLLNGEGLWVINNSVKYSASQIALITKLKLKEGTEVTGIRMRVEAFKSRFAKLGSKIEIEVPYDKGMNPFSGFLELMIEDKIVTQGGAWYTYQPPEGDPIKFQKKKMDQELVDKILQDPRIQEEEAKAQAIINGEVVAPGEAEIAELTDD